MSAMAIVKLVLQIILVIFSLLLTLLILMHKGKGGGLSDMFGGGLTQNAGSSGVGKEPESLDRHHRGAVGCHHHCPRSDGEVRSHLIGFLLRPMTGLSHGPKCFLS